MKEEENQHPKSRKGCKRHKGKRSYFYRTKNDERKWPKIFARRKVLAGLELNSITGFSDPVPIAESPDSDLLAVCFDSTISTSLTDPTTSPDHFDSLSLANTHDPDPCQLHLPPDHLNPALTPGHSDPIMLTSWLNPTSAISNLARSHNYTNLIPSATLSDTSSSNEEFILIMQLPTTPGHKSQPS